MLYTTIEKLAKKDHHEFYELRKNLIQQNQSIYDLIVEDAKTHLNDTQDEIIEWFDNAVENSKEVSLSDYVFDDVQLDQFFKIRKNLFGVGVGDVISGILIYYAFNQIKRMAVKKYREQNKEKIKEYREKYKKNNKEKIKEYEKKLRDRYLKSF